MRCERCREALSADLDGEAGPAGAAAVAAHLDGCAGCREWLRDAERLHPLLRVGAAMPVPDLTTAVLATVPRPHRIARAARIALAVVAAAQLALGIAQFFGLNMGMLPDASDMMSTHLFDEGTAWNLAAGIGLMLVAWRPAAAAGLTSVLGAFVVILAGFCVRDLLDGMVTVSRVASHGLLLLGVILMLVVWRTASPPRQRAVPDRVWAPVSGVDLHGAPSLRRVGDRPTGGPTPAVGRHRAA